VHVRVRGEGVKFREVKITMKQSVIWERHTDFISNRQEIILWGFSISELQRAYEVESVPLLNGGIFNDYERAVESR